MSKAIILEGTLLFPTMTIHSNGQVDLKLSLWRQLEPVLQDNASDIGDFFHQNIKLTLEVKEKDEIF